MRSNGSMRAQIETLIIATSGVQLANGFFNTLISLRVAIENFEATMAGLVLSSYFAGFTLHNIRSTTPPCTRGTHKPHSGRSGCSQRLGSICRAECPLMGWTGCFPSRASLAGWQR